MSFEIKYNLCVNIIEFSNIDLEFPLITTLLNFFFLFIFLKNFLSFQGILYL